MNPKLYRIGEAAELLQLKSYVLRFWETEFPQLVPVRTEKGQRLYSEAHIALLRRIKQLLYEQRMTIEGARQVLEGAPTVAPPPDSPQVDQDFVEELLDELEVVRSLLAKPEEEAEA
ncbi:MAG: MerR family transcriptional regulator [Desulfovibrionaceae bacterium]|nr:MerR family transcriptional regulator [Desulfovibrionaceae bacterium]